MVFFQLFDWIKRTIYMRKQTIWLMYRHSLLSKTYWIRFGGKYKSIQTKWLRKSRTDISMWLNQFSEMDNRNRAIWRIRIVIAIFVFDNTVQLNELQRKIKTKTWIIIHAAMARNQPNGINIRSMSRKRKNIFGNFFAFGFYSSLTGHPKSVCKSIKQLGF